MKFRYYDHLKLRHFIHLKPYLQSLSCSFLRFLYPVSLWLKTTFETVQKWSLRPLLDSPNGGLNIGILLYTLSTVFVVLYTILIHGSVNHFRSILVCYHIFHSGVHFPWFLEIFCFIVFQIRWRPSFYFFNVFSPHAFDTLSTASFKKSIILHLSSRKK